VKGRWGSDSDRGVVGAVETMEVVVDERSNGCSTVETDAKLGLWSFLNTGKPRFAL
jgi:hypothetical protein